MNAVDSYKWIKVAAYAILAAFVITFIALCITVGVKNNTIKKLKAAQKDQTELVIQANNRADSLAKLDCITVNTTFVVNNKNIMSVNTNAINNVNRTYATYTRDEVLHALDSLQAVRESKNK